jgi:dTDP-4-amino-4,6-dideoxygalactose transaminase
MSNRSPNRYKVPFNIPLISGKEVPYLSRLIRHGKFSGDGVFTKKCNTWLEQTTKTNKALLTTSGTHALEMAALLAGVRKGDEVIMSSYTFVSTANAFALRGARLVFVDIRPDTMNINETLIENAVTRRTKVIVPMHYSGVSCEMDAIMDIARRRRLLVVEDAAQAVMATYKGRMLGSIGHIGCYSFHETKNFHCGEGGAILINSKRFVKRSEIIREKGTNRTQFIRGEVDKYTWVDIGSSYLPSELNAVFLLANLEIAPEVHEKRLGLWRRYYERLLPLKRKGLIELPHIPAGCGHNAHSFFIKLKDSRQRYLLIAFLKTRGVQSHFHYIPLHRAVAGRKLSRFHGRDIFTTRESSRLLRLPLFYQLRPSDVDYVARQVELFFL